MDARKFGMVSPFQAGEHIAGLRVMKEPEAQLLKDSINAKKRPMFIFTMFAVGWGIIILVLGNQMTSNACFISLIMFFVIIVMAGTIRGMITPQVQALTDHVVLEVTGTCSDWDGTNIRVGPLDIRVPSELRHIFQEGKLVTVGHLPDTFLGVSVNGITLTKLLDMSTNGALEAAVKDKLVVWPDMGAGMATALGVAYAAMPSRGMAGKRSRMTAVSSQPQERNYIIAKTYSRRAEPVPADEVPLAVPIAEPIQMAQPIPMAPVINAAPGQIVTITKTAQGTTYQITNTAPVQPVAPPPAPAPAPVKPPEPVPPKPVEKPVEPKKEKPKDVFCPYHGTKTELRGGKPWCRDCNNYLEPNPEYCPYHGCRTEPHEGKAFCPRCDSVVEPI